jgi:uncharacterized protein (DUF1697 family)
MTTYIALLRGINVGGNRKIPMADLRALFVDAGCDSVTTYIQSGNVVFTHRTRSSGVLGTDLERRIKAANGFDVPVFLRSASEWAAVVQNNPFAGVEPTKLLVAFLSVDPGPGAADAIDPAAFAPEEFVLLGREVYLHLPNGAGRAKLPQALSVLHTPATTRNWRTVMKLLELAPE